VRADCGFDMHRIGGFSGKFEILQHQSCGEARLVAIIGTARRSSPPGSH
jgi:hypothetical protein